MDEANIQQKIGEHAFNSAFAETVNNGEKINWFKWSELTNISSNQAARLIFHIDPFTWPNSDVYAQGPIPNELKSKINFLEQKLTCKASLWTLATIVDELGEDEVPYGMVEAVQNIKLSDKAHIQLLTDIVKESPKSLDADRIAELWAAIPGESYKNKPFWQIRDDYKKQIENAIIVGELDAIVEIHKPGFDDGFEEITDKNRIRKIKDGWLNGTFVLYTISRDNFRSWLGKSNQWPISHDCLLVNWFITELKAEAVGETDWQKDPSLTKLDKQREAILKVIKSKGFDAMAIPDGEKGTIEMLCREDYPLLFDADSSFHNAWKKSRNLFMMANHASFAKRGRQ